MNTGSTADFRTTVFSSSHLLGTSAAVTRAARLAEPLPWGVFAPKFPLALIRGNWQFATVKED